jgi:hypothetical protein
MSEAMEKAEASKAEAESKSAGLGVVQSAGGFVGGQGGGLGLNAPGAGPKVNHFAAKGTAIPVADEVKAEWQKVMDDAHGQGWVVAEYAADGKSLQLQASGEGGMKEFKEQLSGDKLSWGAFRCWGVDKRGGTECKRTKFIFVQWMPEGVSQIKKAKMGSHKGAMKGALDGAHMDLLCESLDDFEEQGLMTKLQASTGAHKPNGYEFDEGVFLESDYYGLGIGKDCKSETVKPA